MKLLRISAEKPEKDLVSLAAGRIALGKVIVYPTDTVYGIGCRLDPLSVKRVFEIKNRSPDKPLSIAFKDLRSAKEYVSLTKKEEKYIKEHLDKPLTYVVKKSDKVPDIVTGGLDTVGIRIIDNPFVRELLSIVGEPIITTSANVSGGKAPASIAGIDKSVLEAADLVIDCGPCRLGVPSGVVNAASGVVIRSS